MIAGHGGPPDRPDPNLQDCAVCGHVWFAGERDHQLVALGSERDQDTEVLCALCLQKRRLESPGS